MFLLAADRAFRQPLKVCADAIRRWHPDEDIRVADATWLPVEKLARCKLPAHLKTPCLYRLLAPDLLDVDRIVYLDVDTVATTPLDHLLTVKLDGPVAAVRDALMPCASDAGLPWRDLRVEPGRPYFNSGVMVIDVQAWRNKQIGARAIDLLENLDLAFGDQDALNLLLPDWQPLHPRWNLQQAHLSDKGPIWHTESFADLAEAKEFPSVVHFNGRVKPWQPGCGHPLAHLWRDAAGVKPPRRRLIRT